jgi:hypothetical protein
MSFALQLDLIVQSINHSLAIVDLINVDVESVEDTLDGDDVERVVISDEDLLVSAGLVHQTGTRLFYSAGVSALYKVNRLDEYFALRFVVLIEKAFIVPAEMIVHFALIQLESDLVRLNPTVVIHVESQVLWLLEIPNELIVQLPD